MAQKSEGGSRDIQWLHRAFDILETLGRGTDVGVTEVARSTSLPVSTVHNLLRTMAKRHYVVSVNGRYNLGPSVAVLASYWDPVSAMLRTIRAQLEAMVSDIGHTAFGTVLVGERARAIAFHPGPGPIRVSENHEDNVDPLGIATGRLLVALSRESDWDRFVDVADDVEPGWSRKDWRADLRAIAVSGVCVRHSPSVSESTAVVLAVPVWGPSGSVLSSIALGLPTFRISRNLVQRAIDALWDATESLSAELGCDELPLPRPTMRVPALAALIDRFDLD